MEFVFVKKPVVQIKPTSTGKITKSQILILAFLRSKSKKGRVETTCEEIRKGLNISRITVYESIRALLIARLIRPISQK